MTKNKTLSISYTPINSIENNDNRDNDEENDESDCITTPIVVVLNNYNFILPHTVIIDKYFLPHSSKTIILHNNHFIGPAIPSSIVDDDLFSPSKHPSIFFDDDCVVIAPPSVHKIKIKR